MCDNPDMELPIACSLGPADLSARLDEIRALGRDALLAAELDGTRAELRFAPGARERVERIAAAEARCCAFLAFDIRDDDGAVVLTIDAPADAQPVLEELAGTFAR